MSRYLNPVPGYTYPPYGKLFFYVSGTSAPLTTYADEDETIPNTNPVLLDAVGRVPNVWFTAKARVVLQDADDVQVWERDPVGIDGGGLTGFSTYDASILYQKDDIVKLSDAAFYISLQNNNQGNSPSLTPSNNDWWMEVSFIEMYNSNKTYSVGNVAQTPTGLLFRSLVDSNTGNEPTVSALFWQPAVTVDQSEIDTFANLELLRPEVTGRAFICQERANAKYILKPSGYVALSGDVTFANGRVGELQTDSAVNAGWFGAVGDNVNDDTSAIQAAYDFCKNNKKELFINGGIFKCTSTLNFDGTGMNTRGVGSHSIAQTTLLINHNSGAGVHISASRQTLGYLRIKGGNNRQIAAANIADCGLLIEPPDTVGNLISQVGVYWVLSDDHNGSGIVANQITGLTMEQVVAQDCRRHGFVFGNSDESTRTNKDNYSGQLFASECRFSADNYSVLIGAPSGVAQGASSYRVHMRSIDSGGGPSASSAISSYGLSGWWVRGQNVTIESSAFNPGDSFGPAMFISGESVTVGPSNRILGVDASSKGIHVLNWTSNRTRDMHIVSPMVIGDKPTSAVVGLDNNTVAPSMAVQQNTVSVISSFLLNGLIMTDHDKELCYEYSDGQANRFNGNLLSKILVTPSDGDFVAVASGVLDVTGSFNLPTGEGGVADDVDTINFNGGTPPDGMELTLMAGSGSQTITLKHSTGNIRCGSDRALDNNGDVAVLKYRDSTSVWALVSFSDNGV